MLHILSHVFLNIQSCLVETLLLYMIWGQNLRSWRAGKKMDQSFENRIHLKKHRMRRMERTQMLPRKVKRLLGMH